MSREFRHELKYFIRKDQAERLLHCINPYISMDSHYRPKGTFITSLYYDDARSNLYHDKLDGVDQRWKARARIYQKNTAEKPEDVYLEIKHRIGRMINKDRNKIKFNDFKPFSNLPFQQNHSQMTPFYEYVWRYALQPVVLIRYQRSAYESKQHSPQKIRLTIDEHLEYCQPQQFMKASSYFPFLSSNWCVLEIKTEAFVSDWLKIPVQALQLMPEAISKYALGYTELIQKQGSAFQ